MVHVVFSTSEKGSLRVALSGPGGAAAVAVIGGAGGPLGRLTAKREAARQKQQAYQAQSSRNPPFFHLGFLPGFHTAERPLYFHKYFMIPLPKYACKARIFSV